LPTSQDKPADRGRIVAQLAAECHRPVGEIAALFDRARAELAVGARVTRYLHVLATRNVLEGLHARGLDKPPPALGEPAALAV
jgi:hypothetical protein